MTRENDRLLSMLKENKISKEEYKLLQSALHKKTSLVSWLLLLANPFQKFAGFSSLIVGLLIFVGLSYLAVIAKVYFPGILACVNASAMKNITTQPNFFLLFYQIVVSWLILAILFFVAARVFQQKRVRIIDFLGTVALARFPYLILTGFLSVIRVSNPAFLEIDIARSPLHPSLMMSLFALVVVSCVIWQIITYFFALKESSGLSGKKLWISFIAAIILGEVISSMLTTLLY